jgi:hypothetical protein
MLTITTALGALFISAAALVPVTSVAELRARPEIQLEGGVGVRLGIQTLTPAIGSGAFLYCLATSGTPTPVRLPTSGPIEEYLGPLRYEVLNFGASALRAVEARGRGEQRFWQGERFFYAFFATPDAGEYALRFVDQQGRVAATCTMTAAGSDPHPWQSLPCASGPGNRWSIRYHQPPVIALPANDGAEPIDLPDRLPSLASTPTGDLAISQTDGVLVVQSVEAMIDRPDMHLLGRWWVNDAPVPPTEPPGLYSSTGKVETTSRIELAMEHLPRFDVEPGDEVSLQLMYVPCGWTGGLAHALLPPELGASRKLMISNRLTILPESR